MNIKIDLSLEEVNAVLEVLGNLPSKTGAWPLLQKIKMQAEAQLKPAEDPPPAA
jgi:hypothetical protein